MDNRGACGIARHLYCSKYDTLGVMYERNIDMGGDTNILSTVNSCGVYYWIMSGYNCGTSMGGDTSPKSHICVSTGI